jgi:hypothetical protein
MDRCCTNHHSVNSAATTLHRTLHKAVNNHPVTCNPSSPAGMLVCCLLWGSTLQI